MKTKKQSRVDALCSKVSSLTTMSIGIMETIKRMPGYEQAIQKLKEEATQKPSKKA